MVEWKTKVYIVPITNKTIMIAASSGSLILFLVLVAFSFLGLIADSAGFLPLLLAPFLPFEAN